MSQQPPVIGSLIADLVLANHILYQHDVVDAWGHISFRDPADAGRFWLARSLPPALVDAAEIIQFDLEGDPVVPQPDGQLFIERFIHSEIYRARADVEAVLHAHTSSIIPFSVGQTPLRPVSQVAGFLGSGAQVFDIREVDDGPSFLISSRKLGAAVADRLGAAAIILLRGHGHVTVGTSIPQVVWRGVYGEQNARQQSEALRLGQVRYLSLEEADHAGTHLPVDKDRAWTLWTHEVAVQRPATRSPIGS